MLSPEKSCWHQPATLRVHDICGRFPKRLRAVDDVEGVVQKLVQFGTFWIIHELLLVNLIAERAKDVTNE